MNKEIAKVMKNKFDFIRDNLYNSSAYLALILDPRFKTQILPNDISEVVVNKHL